MLALLRIKAALEGRGLKPISSVKSVSLGEEEVSSGEVTEAEEFIDWGTFHQDNDESTSMIGTDEVLRVAQQWSVDPIVEHSIFIEEIEGIVGFL